MSLNAEFIILEKSALNRLRQREDGDISVETILSEYGKPLDNYAFCGYYLAILLLFLAEKEIDLMSSEYNDISCFLSESLRSACFIFSNSHKEKYEETLKSSKYSESELREYYESFNLMEDEEAGKAMIDGIEIFKLNIEKITPDSVIIFRIC